MYVSINMIGVYFESWACPWTDSVEKCELAKIENVDKVFLSFCRPDCTYKKSQGTWSGTGLDFSVDFQIIRQSIQVLKSKGIKVYLSVGGASYSFDKYRVQNVAWLMYDLELDGLDLDWEPLNPVASQQQFIDIVNLSKPFCVTQELCAALFASGCLSPLQGDSYRGCMIKPLTAIGSKLDFINLMNYDAGKGWDYKAAYMSYKSNYNKPIYFGLEVGPQGWGDALLTLDDIKSAYQYLASTDGWFIWAYFKKGDPNTQQVIQYIKSLSQPITPTSFSCPNCNKKLKVSLQ